MKFIFWQNIISIHQSVFLTALAERYPVTLVVEHEIESQRKDDGWSVPSMGNTRIVTAPNYEQIEQLITQNNDSIHVFSGINAFQLVYRAFRTAYKKRMHILVYLEPYIWNDSKGWLRRIKYTWLGLRYQSHIQGVLATGQTGINCYRKAWFSSKKLYQWGYFTTATSTQALPQERYSDKEKPKILFVGRLDHNKNCLLLLDICKRLLGQFDQLTIVGDGEHRDEIKYRIKDIPQVQYLGVLPNEKVKEVMSQHDILVLPSQYDGWGAVVNEALQCGMRVIASENCGASVLLDGIQRGELFCFKGKNQLETVVKRWLAKGKPTIEERQEIIRWTEETISGTVAADYFVKICEHVFENNPNKPTAPWLGNDFMH